MNYVPLLGDSEVQTVEENKNVCLKISLFPIWFLCMIFTVLTSIFTYFSFAGILLLTIHLFVHEWLSLFSKNTVNMIFSVFANFSDFGLIFNLLLFCIYIVNGYTYTIKNMFISISKKYEPDQLSDFQNHKCNYAYTIIMLILFIFSFGWTLTNNFFTFVISMIEEIVFLAFFFIASYKKLYSIIINHFTNEEQKVFNSQFLNNLNENGSFLGGDIYQIGSIIYHIITHCITDLNGMFDYSIDDYNFKKYQDVYRIIIMIIIFALQMYSIILFYIEKSIGIFQLIVLLLVRIFLIINNFKYNFIDMIFNGKRLLKTLKDTKEKIVFWALIALYIIFFILFIIVLFIPLKIPDSSNIKYEKNENKINELSQGFCYAHAKFDGSLKTEDFAMLTTLPRLYGINKNGSCYIKPSKRGLFNTTMKYIFGENYEDDKIQIMCKNMKHHVILVITSEKILKNALSFIHDDNIKLYENQFDINNTNFFESLDFSKLDNQSKLMLNEYNLCIMNNNSNCEFLWDSFTQYYWPHFHSDKYEPIKGFERYQIDINSKNILPSFSIGRENYSGTHYVVGGSYEDHWGLGFLLETIFRSYIHLIFNSILILFSFIRSISKNTFLIIEKFNSFIIYSDIISRNEISKISDLLKNFNFNDKSIYLIGHSITGTAFKAITKYRNIQGISFDSADGDSNAYILEFFKHYKLIKGINQITNIYSEDSVISGFDKNCATNGVLPKTSLFPNVYKTACMTALTCSKTRKYNSFCENIINYKDFLEYQHNYFEFYDKKE